jgi:hypothetical protein
MYRTNVIISLLILVTINFSCKKEESPGYTFCNDCNIEEWTGEYVGVSSYYDSNETKDGVETTVTIENTSGTVLKTLVNVTDLMLVSFYSSKEDSVGYYYSVYGSSKSLDLTLSKNDTEYKLSGTVKTFHYEKDTLVIDESASFITYKK